MAQFVARGFVRFDGVVPQTLNDRFMKEVETGPPVAAPAGTKLTDCYPDSVVSEILRLPEIKGAIESLVGPGCLYDHQGTHFNPPAAPMIEQGIDVKSQHTHQDSTIDVRPHAFDVQMFYYPHEVTPEMGGTRFIPGTHLRRVSEMACARYQNVVGQKKVVCPAGTVIFMHHGMWHGGEINRSDRTRFMLKIRMNPVVKQTRLWNTDDLTDEGAAAMGAPQPIFVFSEMFDRDPNDVQKVLCGFEPWFEMDTGRLEFVNRVKLWRHLIGDDAFDAHHWLSRLENEPQ